MTDEPRLYQFNGKWITRHQIIDEIQTIQPTMIGAIEYYGKVYDHDVRAVVMISGELRILKIKRVKGHEYINTREKQYKL